MATNALGFGTVNLAVNMPREERLILGRLAMSEDKSSGAFVKELLLAGLKVKCPEKAKEIERIRREWKQIGRVSFLIGVLILSFFQKQEMRRPRTTRVKQPNEQMEVAL